MPIFVDATREFDRLYIQKGLFLLWGLDEIPFEEILKNENIDINELIDTIVIDKDSKESILESLKQRNVSEDTLYMNIQKIKDLAKDIKYGDQNIE